MTPHRSLIALERAAFHQRLLDSALTIDRDQIPSIADRASKASVVLAKGLIARMGGGQQRERLPGQRAGDIFEDVCCRFISATFLELSHLRPGTWEILHLRSRSGLRIAEYEQYLHLRLMDTAARANPQLAAALGTDYLISPDIIICRWPEADETINASSQVVDKTYARYTNMRSVNNPAPILHASISCKWTIRSDRSQNARSEALSLVRNRKGKLPHVTVVTSEPAPSRISSIALGTGDIDCVYHMALPELIAAVEDSGMEDAFDQLNTMIEGRRLRDIADLPLDLTA